MHNISVCCLDYFFMFFNVFFTHFFIYSIQAAMAIESNTERYIAQYVQKTKTTETVI